MKIMVVDDEQISLIKIKEQVESFDFVTEVAAFDNPKHALEALKSTPFDAAILDIEMFGMNGLELARQCKCIYPPIKIIFLTGYSDYAVNAFKIRASGYLLKPASNEEIREELLYVSNPNTKASTSKIRIQTFGNFEVFVDNKPILFDRNKSKELLAYLVSRKGAYASGNELLAILYEDKPITPSLKSQLRNIIASLTKSLNNAHVGELLLKRRNQLAIDTALFTCDYYEFLQGNMDSINSFMGEFMNNYEWAEFITGYLESKNW
ncbi:response regulator [Lachnospiraceae bacterium KM106-2]|nr:response regulator [Lachnospiraceae bacterium KM106-2]